MFVQERQLSLTLLCIPEEKRNASINSGVVFLKKMVDFI